MILRERAGISVARAGPTRVRRAPSSSRKCAVRSRASRRPMPTRCSTTIASSRDAAQSTAVASLGGRKGTRRSLSSTSDASTAVTGSMLWSAVRNRTNAGPESRPVSGNRRSGASRRATACKNKPIPWPECRRPDGSVPGRQDPSPRRNFGDGDAGRPAPPSSVSDKTTKLPSFRASGLCGSSIELLLKACHFGSKGQGTNQELSGIMPGNPALDQFRAYS